MRTAVLNRVPVIVRAQDPISRAGVESQLRFRSEIEVLADNDAGRAEVAVVVADQPSDEAVQTIRELRRRIGARVVLLASSFDDNDLLTAIEAGVTGIVRRNEATAERLTTAVQAALSGDGSVPPDLLGRLLTQMGSLQRHLLGPRGLTLSGLTQRELAVLRLVAEGCSTSEIATALSYSERTIKNTIHDLVTRLQLRNRSHAVAYAVREGLI
jgi:DNA-binding NarL/FixJ family response regulator